jgi:RNA polymerase sigma factor (sigma-70 family)
VGRVRQRDRDEFERVFRSAYRSVLGSAYLVLHDRGRAEEVTQDAFVRLYERWGRAVAIDHPEAWVRTVVMRDAIRRAKRERVVPVVEVVDREDPVHARPHDLDLIRAVAGLPPQQRAAVALYYLEDRPVDEVAHLLDVAPATVRQHLFRARKQLCAVLGESLEEVTRDVDR